MKHYYATSPADEMRLGEGELITAGEEILSRARVLAEALAKKVQNSMDRESGAGSVKTMQIQPIER